MASADHMDAALRIGSGFLAAADEVPLIVVDLFSPWPRQSANLVVAPAVTSVAASCPR